MINHYVTTTGTDTYANATNPATPCSLSTAFTALSAGGTAAAGDRICVKAGNYTTRGANDTLTIDGSVASPIVIEGYNSTPGDLNNPLTYNSDGTLITTNYPVITYSAGFRLNASAADEYIFRNLSIVAAGAGINNVLLPTGFNCVVHQCYINNPSTGGSAGCLLPLPQNIIENCDLVMSTSATGSIINAAQAGCCFIGNRFVSGVLGIYCSGNNQYVILDNVFFPAILTWAMYFDNSNAGSRWIVRGNTYAGPGVAIGVRALTFTSLSYYGNNHFTDGTTAILSLQDATSQQMGWFSHNRFRDNSVADVDGWDDWKAGGTAGEVTTDTGGPSTDYTAVGSNQLRLIVGAPGVGTASIPNRDIGALQRASGSGATIAGPLIGPGRLIRN